MKTTYTHKPESLQIIAERTFSAEKAKGWKFWTEAELLDLWWGPEPYKAVTKSFDFREGGHWHYYMKGPEGDVHWCMVHYHTIAPLESFTATDEFSDEEGNSDTSLPSNNWHVQFSEAAGVTTATVEITFQNEEDMKKLVSMGFQEGFNIGLDQLEKLLA